VKPFRNEPALDLREAPVRERLLRELARLDATLPQEVPLLIGAAARAAGRTLDSVDPGAPERVVAHAAVADAADVERAVAGAAAALDGWAATPVRHRVDLLLRAADLLRTQRERLAALAVRECGKPWREADADVCEAIDFVEYYARLALRLADGVRLLQVPGEQNALRYRPRGVTVVIAPWNFPLAIPCGMVVAALATGNTAILKPAEQAPACGRALVELLHAAGIPRDALALVPGDGETGALLSAHPGVATIAFTGSLAAGRAILRTAAETSERQLKRVVAETSGKNCVVLDADADLDEAVPALLDSAFGFAGQKCSAASRALVHEALWERLLERLRGGVETLVVGPAEDFATSVPPLIDAEAHARVGRYQALAADSGAAHAGAAGPARGWYRPPTLAWDLPPDSPLLEEEVFGPLLALEPVASMEEACARVAALPTALTAGVFARNPDVVAAVARALPSGNLYVNRGTTGAIVGRQPFGGARLSGTGPKAGGPDYLLGFVDAQVVTENVVRHGLVV